MAPIIDQPLRDRSARSGAAVMAESTVGGGHGSTTPARAVEWHRVWTSLWLDLVEMVRGTILFLGALGCVVALLLAVFGGR